MADLYLHDSCLVGRLPVSVKELAKKAGMRFPAVAAEVRSRRGLPQGLGKVEICPGSYQQLRWPESQVVGGSGVGREGATGGNPNISLLCRGPALR
jgi:hypothetical protein